MYSQMTIDDIKNDLTNLGILSPEKDSVDDLIEELYKFDLAFLLQISKPVRPKGERINQESPLTRRIIFSDSVEKDDTLSLEE